MKWGGDSIGKIQWGSSVIGKIYYGSNLVYDSGGAPTVSSLIIPIFDGVYPVYGEVARGFAWRIPAAYRQIDGIVFDGGVYYATTYRLRGADTLRLSFKASQNCNVIGCYTTTSATTNYSLYVSTTSTAKYLRYYNGTYNSSIVANTRYDVTITPTGSSGMRTNSSWTAKTFSAESDMLIGMTSTSATSSMLVGTLYGNIEVEGRALYIPVERLSDDKIGYYDVFNDTFLANQGSGTPTELTS